MPIPYAGSSEMIPVNPSGYVPRPRVPTDPNRNRDLLGNVVDPAMEPDMGVGAQPPRDPYMASLPPRQPRAAPGAPVTTLTPGRTSPFSRADAQALAALDEAKAIAAMPESTPAKITGSFGGQSFEMQPSARVDRNALARLYAQAQQRKEQERQDAVRGQEQSGRERIVTIPGEQATQRRQMELETEERVTGKKLEADAPMREADIAAKRAQTAATMGGETRAQAEADAEAARRPSPAQEALERQREALASNPIMTADLRRQIADLDRQILAGRGVPAEQAAAAAAPAPGPDIGSIAADIAADPGIAAILARARETKPGTFSGSTSRQTGAAARQLAERAIAARVIREGGTPEDAQQIVMSILGPSAQNAGSPAVRAAGAAFPGPIGAALNIGLAAQR